MNLPKFYLGDGAYADYHDGELILTTSNGIRDTNTIILGAHEWRLLTHYMQMLNVGEEKMLDDWNDHDRPLP